MRVTLWPTGETVRTPAAEDAGNTAKWHELVAVSYTDRADADKGTTPILRVEVIEDGLTTTLIGMLEIPVLPFVLNEGHLMKSWCGGVCGAMWGEREGVSRCLSALASQVPTCQPQDTRLCGAAPSGDQLYGRDWATGWQDPRRHHGVRGEEGGGLLHHTR